jgi:hypothetical protein
MNKENSHFDLFRRFTDNAKQSLLNAQEVSKQKGRFTIDADDLLVGISMNENSAGSKILKSIGFDPKLTG